MAIPITRGNFRGPRPLSPQGNAAIQTMQPQLGGQNAPRPDVMQTMQQPAPYNMPQAQTAMQPQNTQQYGLSGAESAYNQALSGAGQALQQGTNQALGTLQGGYQSALGQLGQGQAEARASNVDPMTGQPMFQQAAQGVGQFAGAGLSAQQRQAALSGALGQEAQQQAYQEFNASPGQSYLQEQGMRQVLNANTATGGLGGGNVLQELQRQGMGLAQQDYQNQFNNLGSLSNQGLQAAGQQGQFLSQAGQQQGNLAGQNAQMQTQANLARANLFGQGANIAGQMASQGAGYQASQGTNIANLLSGMGGNIAQGRMQAGRDIAGNVANTSGALGGLANQQGQGLSDIVGQGGVNVGNMLQGYGNMTAQQQQQMGTLLSNLAVGQGSQQAGITQDTGLAVARGALRQGQNTQNLLGNLAQAGGYYLGNQAPALTPPPQGNYNWNQAAINAGVS